jgi:hypothetical protein
MPPPQRTVRCILKTEPLSFSSCYIHTYTPQIESQERTKPRREEKDGRAPAAGGGGAGEPAAAGGEEDGQGLAVVAQRRRGGDVEEGVLHAAVAGQGPEGRPGGGRAVAEGDPHGGAVPAAGLLRGHLLRRRGPPPRAPAAAAVAHAQPATDAAQARRQRRKVLAPALLGRRHSKLALCF